MQTTGAGSSVPFEDVWSRNPRIARGYPWLSSPNQEFWLATNSATDLDLKNEWMTSLDSPYNRVFYASNGRLTTITAAIIDCIQNFAFPNSRLSESIPGCHMGVHEILLLSDAKTRPYLA
jgi:hypothetical protein